MSRPWVAGLLLTAALWAGPAYAEAPCPMSMSGHPLGPVDVYDGPPSDGYLVRPMQPGRRDIWEVVGPKPTFIVCRYIGTSETREVRLPTGLRTCEGTRASGDRHMSFICR